jgi:GNAT superfamily N-acetyltransferase
MDEQMNIKSVLDDVCISQCPPSWWADNCRRKFSLFDSIEWQQVLHKGLACKSLYVWDLSRVNTFPISVFKAGPFRVGYISFPVGAKVSSSFFAEPQEMLNRIKRHHIDLLRISVSGFSPWSGVGLHTVTVPETSITNLADWNLLSLPKLRRALRKANCTPCRICDLDVPDGGKLMYELYRETILARRGSLRYTPSYFQALQKLSEESAQLRCICSFHDGKLSGFVIAAIDTDTGYYLHGSTAAQWRSTGISYLLLYAAIEWARETGMSCFNMMASPATQHGLVRYKEKFGGTTCLQHVYELPIFPFRAHLFKIGLRMHNMLNMLKNRK